MRIAAISLPDLRIELVRATRPDPNVIGPLAIVVAPAPLTEAKLLGNTRLDVVSREARHHGISAGQTIAQARARYANLAVRVVRPADVEDVLARLAEVALGFGATASFHAWEDADDAYGDVVWVDVTGCAHLHSTDQHEGEALLASRLAGVVAALGHHAAVAVADGPRVSAILARTSAITDGCEALVVPSGENARALGPLPIAALPMSGDDERWLRKVGVLTIEALRALPRAPLAMRLGASAPALLALADGDDRAPLRPWSPPEIPEEVVTLEYGVEASQAITFVAKMLCDRLAARLAGRAVCAARLELDLELDAGMLDRGAEKLDRIEADLPAPLSQAGDLLAALRPKIERFVLRAPVLAAKLRAPVLVHKREAVLSLFEPQPRAERALPRLCAELTADLGDGAVGVLSLGNSWVPEERSRLTVPVLLGSSARAGRADKKPHHLLSSVPEPTRLADAPIPVAREDIRIVRHLTRVESTAWWKGDGKRRTTDFVYAWTDDGPACVMIDRRSGAAHIRGWFD